MPFRPVTCPSIRRCLTCTWVKHFISRLNSQDFSSLCLSRLFTCTDFRLARLNGTSQLVDIRDQGNPLFQSWFPLFSLSLCWFLACVRSRDIHIHTRIATYYTTQYILNPNSQDATHNTHPPPHRDPSHRRQERPPCRCAPRHSIPRPYHRQHRRQTKPNRNRVRAHSTRHLPR